MAWKKRVGTILAGMIVIASFEACAGSEATNGFVEEDGGGADGTTPVSIPETGAPTNDTGTTPTPVPDAQADAPIEVGPLGNPIGFPCAKTQDCASGLCQAVLTGSGSSVCVTACTAQADCPDNFFCDPATPGAMTGFCVPRSPAHCKACTTSAECGSLSEQCGTADGDTVKACHVDCTIGDAAACPPDYTCTPTMLDGVAAKVCRPTGGLSCLDSLGGFCDRVATPQPCKRTNVAGVCVGQRACLAASTRLDTCGATAPVCKLTCSTTSPAGCTASYCEEATAAPTNCGACGTVCPGHTKPNVNVGCNQPTCTYSCKGESYDVDGSKANGCEVTETSQGNHTANTATSVGDKACHDDATPLNMTGRLPSDTEVHETPAVEGFNTTTGSAPDYFSINATGDTTFNPCVNNVDLTLTMTGSAKPECYHLHVETNKNTYDCDTSAAGTCRINPGGSSLYDNDTEIIVVVSKRPGCIARDNPTYAVKGHL